MLSNTPPATPTLTTAQPAPTPPASAAQRTGEDVTRNFEVGREVSVERTAIGAVRRVSVAVALADGTKKRSGAEIAAIDALVKSAVGFDAARGDVVTVGARPFVRNDPPAEAWYRADWLIAQARNLGGVIVALGLLFGLVRPWWKRRQAANDARRAEIAGLIGTELAAAPGARNADVTIDMIEATPSYTARVAMVRDFVRADPARAARVVRTLVEGAPA